VIEHMSTLNVQAAHLPVPYFQIDASLRIIGRSNHSDLLFPKAVWLEDIVDEDSVSKLTLMVKPKQTKSIEINLLSPGHPPALFELYQQWEDERTGHVILIPLQSRIQELQQTMENLREDFSQTDLSNVPMLPMANLGERKQLQLHLDASSALETIEDLMVILRADFIELDKTAYSDIINEKIVELREALAQLKNK
jgi:hypothetical protein